MASHDIILFDRATPSGYPSSLTGDEQILYDAGSSYKFPLLARVHQVTTPSVVKIQALPIPADNCDFAVRGPASEQGTLHIAALTGDFYRVQMTQQAGASAAIGSTFASGLLTINLPTDALGRGSGTIDVVHAYINASLSTDFVATKSGITNKGALGETFGARPCAMTHWTDVATTVGGVPTAAIEHTLAPGAGLTADFSIELDVKNYFGVRALAKSASAPDPADHVTILAAVEGA